MMFTKTLKILTILALLAQPANAACPTSYSLMNHFNGADGSTTAIDSSTFNHTMTSNGAAQLDTAQVKLGSASALFAAATSDKFTAGDSEAWNMGTGDWTIGFFMRRADTGSDQIVFELGNAASDGIRININNGLNQVDVQINGSTQSISLVNPLSFAQDTWYWVVLYRNSADEVQLYIDNVSQLSLATSGHDITGGTDGIAWGGDTTAAGIYFNGWIDEGIVIKGTGADITIPTTEFCTDASTGNMFLVFE